MRFLERNGFSRVVLAREVSIHNIELIGKAAKLPLEVFVHGALCVSYSGQCLMSSMIGGRSGNRGRCAQPCRLPYTLVGKAGDEIIAGHLLSPKDLNMIDHLSTLEKAGVRALKVEGRMKRPEYVATVIRNYRKALDMHDQVDDQMHKELLQIFNREFTTGYYLEKPGPHLMSYKRPNNRGLMIGRVVAYNSTKMEVAVSLEEPVHVGDGYEIWVTKGGRIAGEIRSMKQEGQPVDSAADGEISFNINEGTPRIGDRVFKTMDINLIEEARNSYQTTGGVRKFPLAMTLRARNGETVKLTVSDEAGYLAEATGTYVVEIAQKHPLTKELAEKQLERLGNTAFYLRSLEFDCADGLMVPVSELNSLRRETVEQIENQRREAFAKPGLPENSYKVRVKTWLASLPQAKTVRESRTKIKLSVLVGDMDSLVAALEAGAEIIYFGGEKLRRKNAIGPELFSEAVQKCRERGAESVLLLPRIYHEEKAGEVAEYCLEGQKAGVDGFLAGNPGTIQLAAELGLRGLNADYTLNIFNDFTIKSLLASGAVRMTLSPELQLEQIKKLRYVGLTELECIVHGRLPLMLTEHCTVGNTLGQGHRDNGCPMPCNTKEYGLRDRLDMVFPLECDENCRMLVYNPRTLSLIDRMPGIIESGIKILRIEARREESYWVRKVVGVYREELDRYSAQRGTQQSRLDVSERNKETLKSLAPAGYTTGHYFRGVL